MTESVAFSGPSAAGGGAPAASAVALTGADTSNPPAPASSSSAGTSSGLSHSRAFTSSFLAGAVAGATAKTTIAPLDRTKIWFQTHETRFNLRACLAFLRDSYRSEGLLRLWRGNTATLARIVPYSSVQFASHEQYKRLLHVDGGRFESAHWRRFVSGSLAGVTSVTCTYPLDMARARMAVTKSNTYRNLGHALRCIWRQEGALALYRGFSPALAGSLPYAGTSFYTYETLKRRYRRQTGQDPGTLPRFVFGGVAGLFGQTSSYPLDIVRRRMQTAQVTGHPEYTKGIWHCLRLTYQHEGIVHGLYKGLSMNFVKGPIANGIAFATFDLVQWLLRRTPMFSDQQGGK
uniref:Mitochondrial coenzyme A transporter SLC25A42 n=2 Tax=Macrostomum lignano TaxID=282301 RepID=A0A1I8I8U5_9PLAT